MRLPVSRSNRPGSAYRKSRPDHRIEECFPTRAGCSFVLRLGLLKRVVDGDWEGRVSLLGQAVHRLGHAVKKNASASSFFCGDMERPPVLPLWERQAW